MPQGQREKQPKTSACYFLIGTLAPDTTQPWTDARTVIWRILLVSAALEVPFFTGNVTWASKDKHQKEGSRGFCDQALQLAAVSRRMTSWTSCCFWGKGCDPANSYLASGKIRGASTSVMVKPSNRHRYWMSSWSVMCQTAMLTSILPPLTA